MLEETASDTFTIDPGKIIANNVNQNIKGISHGCEIT